MSSNKSWISSIPTDSLTKLSNIPNSFLYSAGTEPCVMTAGSSARLSTPPKLSAKVNTFNELKNLCDSLFSPLITKDIIPP